MGDADLFERFRWLYDGDARNLDDLRSRWTEDAVIHQDPNMPGTRGEFHGYEGIQALDGELRDAFDEIEWDPQEVHELGDDRYVVLLLVRGRGHASGVRFDEGVEVGHIVELHDGRVASMQAFIGWQPALEAAGVAAA